MGKYDDAMCEYLDDNERFADLFNVALFGGAQVLRGEMLEADSERYVTREESCGGKVAGKVAGKLPGCVAGDVTGSSLNRTDLQRTGNRFRDLKKRLKNGDWLAITAVENQESIDYTMPLRMMEYDCLEYMKQVRRLKRKRELETVGAVSRGSAWKRIWLGPDDKIHSVFKTELRQLMEVIPCRRSKGKLKELFEREEYRHLDRDTAEVVAVFTDNIRMLEMLEEDNQKEDYDMCQALEELVADGRAEGRIEGRIEGRTEGRFETLLESIQNLMNSMSLTAEQAMELLAVPMEERPAYSARI